MKSIASRMLSAIPTLAACLALSVIDAPQALADTANPTEPEESDVAAITPPKPGWIFVNRGFVFPGTAIYDTGNGKMLGLVQTALLADMAIDPAGKFYYVAETIWSKGNRGTRQDMVTVYDLTNLAAGRNPDSRPPADRRPQAGLHPERRRQAGFRL
jgi:methylamine dehydrogenase heavy chain